jgi:hypothetical protein
MLSFSIFLDILSCSPFLLSKDMADGDEKASNIKKECSHSEGLKCKQCDSKFTCPDSCKKVCSVCQDGCQLCRICTQSNHDEGYMSCHLCPRCHYRFLPCEPRKCMECGITGCKKCSKDVDDQPGHYFCAMCAFSKQFLK